MFNFFINDLLNNENICFYQLIFDFIILSPEEYAKSFIKYNSLQKVTNFSYHNTLTGTVDVSLRPGALFKCKEIKKYLDKKSVIYKNLLCNVKEIIKDHENLRLKYDLFLKQIKELESEYSKEFLNNKYLPSMIKNLSKEIEKFEKIQANMKNYLTDNIHDFFKYFSLEYAELSSLLTGLKFAETNFDDCKTKLKNEVNKIEKKKKEKELLEARRQFFYMQNQIEDENLRVHLEQSRRFRKVLGDIRKMSNVFDREIKAIYEAVGRINSEEIEENWGREGENKRSKGYRGGGEIKEKGRNVEDCEDICTG